MSVTDSVLEPKFLNEKINFEVELYDGFDGSTTIKLSTRHTGKKSGIKVIVTKEDSIKYTGHALLRLIDWVLQGKESQDLITRLELPEPEMAEIA